MSKHDVTKTQSEFVVRFQNATCHVLLQIGHFALWFIFGGMCTRCIRVASGD